MSKSIKIGIIIGIVVLLVFGGWYVYKTRACTKNMIYVPPREGRDAGSGFYGVVNSVDKGDYYQLGVQKFKTSDDAIRACMWE